MKPNRSISPNAQAICFSLRCEVPKLRQAAEAHVLKLIHKHQGSTGRIADELSMSRRTYTRWLEEFNVLAQANADARPLKVRGPVPVKSAPRS